MKKIFVLILLSGVLSAQTFTVENVSGNVSVQKGGEENWTQLKKGMVLENDATIVTDDKSLIELKGENIQFKLGEASAVSTGSIKKMNLDDLLLALAMEDMINAPKKINKSSDNTAVYGSDESKKKSQQLKPNDFGIKRLNGAMQIAENGMEEAAVVTAKENYRKYPATKKIASYRIYFADILYKKGLYEEALKEYYDIVKLDLTKKEKDEVNSRVESIKMKLMSE